MSSIAIAVEPKGFEALRDRLNQIEARIPRAIAQGLNEGGDLVRTQVQRGLQQQAGLVRYKSVTSRVSTMRAYAAGAPRSGIGPVAPTGAFGGVGLAYTIVVRGKPATRIEEFAYGAKTGPGGYVWARMWGVTHIFQRSFQKPGTDGPKGLRARLGAARFPIRSFDGPNLAKELGKGIVPGRFYATTAFVVPPAVIKHLQKVM